VRPVLLVLVVLAAGCFPGLNKAESLQKQAEADYAKENYAACSQHMGEAIETRRQWWGANGASDLSKLDNVAIVRRMAQAYHVHALCLKGEKRDAEAVGEMETAIKYMTTACTRRGGDWIVKSMEAGNKDATCGTAADDAETLARWKKEAR
jgi:hypothetical protein